MLKNYDVLNTDHFNQQCERCLMMIFDSAFQNIALFQHLLEDRPRLEASIKSPSALKNGLGNLVTDIQEEWAEIFIQGLQLSGRSFERTEVNLCVDIASAQVHELILGCHQQRYSRPQAIAALKASFDALFAHFLQGGRRS